MTDKEYSDMGVVTTVGKDFKTLDVGKYDFVINGVIGLGLHPRSYEGKPVEPAALIKIIFEMPPQLQQNGDSYPELRDDGLPHVAGWTINPSVSPKSNFYKFCVMLLGDSAIDHGAKPKQLKSELVCSVGLKQLLGKVGVLTFDEWTTSSGEIAKSVKRDGFYPLDPRLPKPVAVRPPFFFSPFAPDIEIFNNTITYSTKEKIMSALNTGNYPPELHAAWVKAQEEHKANSDGNQKKAPAATAAPPWSPDQTTAIE